MSADFISVSVLNNYIKNIMDSEELLHNINIVGEISGIKCSGAHSYFNLKDENNAIMCSCFNYARTYAPKDGEAVVLTGSVDYYGKTGKLSFIARTIKPFGMGLLALKLEELKKALTAQGYFDSDKKKPVPRFCQRIAVITSKTGAVIRDIITTARKKNLLLNIEVYDVRVQGQDAVASIISALKFADLQVYDAIIIARGGGSLEDLMPFNDERLVQAIYHANTPIISAVGHETDFTLCDMVADIRVPTPTAAGELVAFDSIAVMKLFYDYYRNMKGRLEGQVSNQYLTLTSAVSKMVGHVKLLNANYFAILEKSKLRVVRAMEITLANKENAIEQYLAKLESNNPLRILRQGYSKIYDNKGKPREAISMKIGEDFTLLGDGVKLSAKVVDKELLSIGECKNV